MANGIVIRGGNHHIKNDIYIPLSKEKLIDMGFLKEGEEPDASTASKVQGALKINVREVPDDRFGPDYYLDLAIGDVMNEYPIETYWYSTTFGNASKFASWLRNTHLTIRPEDVWENAGRGSNTRQIKADEGTAVAADDAKGAIDTAFKAVAPKLFTNDIDDDLKHSGIDIWPRTPDDELCGVSWRILPDAGVVARYADNLNDGTSEVVAELDFNTLEELEDILADEFASLDETLQISLDNGGWEMKVSAKIQYLDEFDPEYSGKETIAYGVGPDKETAKKNALTAFFMENPDAEIHGTPLFSVVEKNEKLNPKSADEITADEFAAYRKVQMGGKYNMLMDSQAAAMDAGLDDETYWGIIKNYSDLYAKYGG